jgi:hypothetical protein
MEKTTYEQRIAKLVFFNRSRIVETAGSIECKATEKDMGQ